MAAHGRTAWYVIHSKNAQNHFTYTFVHYNNIDYLLEPTDAQRPTNKRRKRKGSNSGGGANNTPPVPSKKRSPGPNFSLASQVVVFFRSLDKCHAMIEIDGRKSISFME